jgi:hypothetical protein
MKNLFLALCLVLVAGCSTPPQKPHRTSQEIASATQAQLEAIFGPGIVLGVLEPVSYEKYKTQDEAAIAAFKQIAEKRTSVYEWGGLIGRNAKGEYAFSAPVTDFEGDHVELLGGLPPDFEHVADYHTHPCIADHMVEYFSPPDLFGVLFARREATYMGDWCTGSVHLFKRGDKPDVDAIIGGIWLTKGRIIGKFAEPQKVAS